MKKRYTTYIDKTGKLWTFDHKTKVLFDSYDPNKKHSSVYSLAEIKSTSLKEVWSTDKNGKYL